MAHAFATHATVSNQHAALFADDAFVLHARIFTAEALPVFGWSKDLLAEKTIAFRFIIAVVDGLRPLDLTLAPGADDFRRCQADGYRIVIGALQGRRVEHVDHGTGLPVSDKR